MKSLGSIRRSFAPWTDPTAKPFIAFENVTKRFGDFTAVDNLSLNVYEREFFALLGASGCGKSTLLRMLAGFEEPSAGRILLDGQDLAGIPPYRRPVNMMFQSYALFPHMTVEKNIAYGLKQDGMAKADIEKRVAEMLKLVKLEQFAKRKPHQLSGGQRQRVALARSVAKRPKVLLLDEPLGALDKKLREETQFELMDLQQQLGLTFMVVTHDQEEAMTMADRIAIMDKGEVMQVATPAEVYEAPASRFVADFVGSVNIFEGRIAGRDEGRIEIATADGVTIRADDANAAGEGTVWYAVRPEKIRISSKKPENPALNAIEGEVWDIGYLGDMTVYNVKLAGGQIVRSSELNRHRTSEDPLTWNDRAWLTFPADAGVVLTR
ncbi:ABC transporter ATP-binding protein [Aliihoeflea sp. 2WW]|uniref:ABC transporter ATP-binding protein n=1 Tax=Aliihoeflea sp. 2WW TaxID=1381123 RepID=UPI00046413A4|nr:ABC transporter ATP-binding protein [Aliihoeflea sp. 2WW]